MKIHKILCLALSLCIMAGMCVLPRFAAAAGNPKYIVNGVVSGDKLTLTVRIHGALSYSGHLALAYDKNLLELANKSSLAKAVKQASGVTVTAEGHASSVLLGDGHVMFAWYASNSTGVDAAEADRDIATITFNLLGSASDFSRNTIGLYYVNGTMVDGWSSSCEIIANTNGKLDAYRNTATDEGYLCGIEYDYPNSDYVPPETYDVTVNVKNTDGKALDSALVTIDNIEAETNIIGNAAFKLLSGTYFYRASSPGYEIKSGYLIVDGDRQFNVTLRSYGRIAADEAAALQIGYAEGDSAENVTTDLILPSESGYGTVSWLSNSSAVTDYGVVKRGEDDIAVTLVAAVTVGQATATKKFDVVVKSRLTAEQKNAAIVSKDKANLEIGYVPGDDADNVTIDLTLPETGSAGSAISWESSDIDIISATGKVSRPMDDAEVTLTAYIMRDTVTALKKFTVMVKGTGRPAPEPTEEPEEPEELEEPETPTVPPIIDEDSATTVEIVNRIIDALEITYAKGDGAESVKSSITLPSIGTEGSTITWTSSLPAVITPYGGVVRQAEDAEVTLTATVSRGEVSAQKTFTVTVKAADEIPQNPSNGQEEEIEVKNLSRRSGGRSSTDGTANGGGGTDTDTAESTEPTPTPTSTPAPAEKTTTERKQFIDIDNVPWAENAINALAERGVINGTSENTYSPNNNIRRADFVMLLMKLYELDAEITDTFEDVTESNYYYSDISKAKSLGIISGIDETHFNPEGSITRQDMMTMTYRALQKLGKTENMTEASLSEFNDADSILDYAFESVKYLVGGGYIHGDNSGYLNPLSNTTRAETAVFLYGLVQ